MKSCMVIDHGGISEMERRGMETQVLFFCSLIIYYYFLFAFRATRSLLDCVKLSPGCVDIFSSLDFASAVSKICYCYHLVPPGLPT